MLPPSSGQHTAAHRPGPAQGLCSSSPQANSDSHILNGLKNQQDNVLKILIHCQ